MGEIVLSGQALAAAQLARRMGLARQGVQCIVNDLEKLGLLTLNPNLGHKRAALVSITAERQKAIKQINAAQAAWVNQLSERFSERHLKHAFSVFQSLREQSLQLH